MAYNSEWITCAQNYGTSAMFRKWFYATTDNNAAVTAAGYFTDGGLRGMQVGDLVDIVTMTTLPRTTPVDAGLYLVSAISAAGAATVIAAVAAA
jgi:hypothetical protein